MPVSEIRVKRIRLNQGLAFYKTLETYFLTLSYFWTFAQIPTSQNGTPRSLVFAHIQEAIKKSMYSQKKQPVAI